MPEKKINENVCRYVSLVGSVNISHKESNNISFTDVNTCFFNKPNMKGDIDVYRFAIL